LVGSILRASTL